MTSGRRGGLTPSIPETRGDLGRILAFERHRAIRELHQPRRQVVVTRSPCDESWSNTHVVNGELSAFVKQLKQQPGGDIGVHGSIALTQALLKHGLVDELRLVIAPAIQTRGQRLFADVPPRRLTLTRAIVSPAGYLLNDFRVDS
jgi:dihydrofolate reductase